jgi:hypothetical protein
MIGPVPQVSSDASGAPGPDVLCPSESGSAAAPAVSASAALLVGHVLSDGEIVQMLLRPSRWFILLTSLWSVAVVVILVTLAIIFSDKIRYAPNRALEAGIFVIAGRLMWATLQWMGRLYILTDMRIVRLSGIFHVEVFDCPLRKVARALLDATVKERLVRIGSIVIVPVDEQLPLGVWQMVSRPRHVHEKVLATIARAKK